MLAPRITTLQRLAVSLCALGLVSSGCDSSLQGIVDLGSAAHACVVPPSESDLVQQAVALINQERELRGLNPLRYNESLADMADAYACTMIENGFFGHENPATGEDFAARHSAGQFRCYPAGENLAFGHDSARMVFDAWMDSESHKENILTDSFVDVGIGVRQDADTGWLYWVQLFVGERVDGCEDADPDDAPAPAQVTAPSASGVTAGLSPEPTMPTDRAHEPLTDPAALRP